MMYPTKWLVDRAVRRVVRTVLVVSACLAGACRPESPPAAVPAAPFTFTDVTLESGLDFTHYNDKRHSLLPEDMGSGVAWGDIDDDGDQDLFCANWAAEMLLAPEKLAQRPGNRLYENLGSGRFRDITVAAGVARSAWDTGALFADFDGDGRLDIIVVGFRAAKLYRNLGERRFADATDGSGLDAMNEFALGPTVADYDRDGDLDLYVPGYVVVDFKKYEARRLVGGRPETMTTPNSYRPARNFLFRNVGGLRFEEVAEQAGVLGEKGRGLQAVFCDVNDDLWPDLWVGNDQSYDALYENLGNGTFRDVAGEAQVADIRASMGFAVGDADGDGDQDFYLTHFVNEQPAFWRNDAITVADGRKRPFFESVENTIGVLGGWDRSLVGWYSSFGDFDNDSDADLFVAHGSAIEDELTWDVLQDPQMIPQACCIFENVEGHMHNRSSTAGAAFSRKAIYRGGALADFDGDGQLDVLVGRHDGPLALLRNTSANARHWLGIRLQGEGANRHGIGARIVLHAGGKRQVRHVLCGVGYLGSDSLIAHFGLGDGHGAVEVEVTWPASGKTRRHAIAAVDRVVDLAEAE